MNIFIVINIVITYNTRLSASQEDIQSLTKLLEYERLAFNEAAKIQYGKSQNNILFLHAAFYRKFRIEHPEIPSQIVIRGEQGCLSAYRSIKSNKQKITKPIEKKHLSCRLDKRIYSLNKDDKYSINITTANKRKTFKYVIYPKLKNLLDSLPFCDPLIYLDNKNNLCISFTFKTPKEQLKQKLALGVDLGIRRVAACSDGRLIIDKGFNARKRQLRHLKRQLRSKGTKSARKHLNKVRHKEHNINKNQTHLIVNEILKTNADTIVLENLKGIKAKKHKFQNKNKISQVPFYELRRIISYKAENMGKTISLVNPAFTSQIDCLTGKKDGKRQGCRYYATSGLVYDADLNAARNIANRSKLPVSYRDNSLLDGQGTVNCPIVFKSGSQELVSQASMASA